VRPQPVHELDHHEGEVQPNAEGERAIEALRQVVMVPVPARPTVLMSVMPVLVRMAVEAARMVVLGIVVDMGCVCHRIAGSHQKYTMGPCRHS
jgi:hypothetical protein